MKQVFVLIIILSFVSLSGQEFPDELNNGFQQEVCDCLNNSPQKKMETAGACIDNWITKYSAKFNSYIDFNSKKNPQEQFSEIAVKFIRQNRENLIVNCGEITEILRAVRKKLLENDKKNYESIDLDSINKSIDNKEDNNFLLTRAKYYFFHDEWDRSKADFNKILESDPQNDKAVYFLGLINELTGNYREAVDLYHQLIDITKDETYLNDIYIVKRKMKERSGN